MSGAGDQQTYRLDKIYGRVIMHSISKYIGDNLWLGCRVIEVDGDGNITSFKEEFNVKVSMG